MIGSIVWANGSVRLFVQLLDYCDDTGTWDYLMVEHEAGAMAETLP